LLELLLAIAIIAILAALLLPALATAQARGKQIACLKQLALGSQTYAHDNEGKLVGNTPKDSDPNRWVAGTMKSPTDATNHTYIQQGKLFPYAGQLATYRCPSDPARTQGMPRVRSYAMNGWMGSRYMESYSGQKGFRTFVKDSELAAVGPANLWGLTDEHEASIDDGWFLVTMDDSQPFASFPATRHQQGYNLNFADGHAQVFKLRDANTQFPVRPGVSAKNSDWLRLKQVTTTR
jgi:prepilin-type processing-associated H-X9-DG protein